MTREEIIEKAKYIQFPYINEEYKDRYKSVATIKVPLAEGYNPLYSKAVHDTHHYTTKFHIKNVLPLLESIYGFGYRRDDFKLKPLVCDDGDYSYLVPKKDMKFDVYRYDLENGPHIERGINYDGLLSEKHLSGKDKHRYWGLYKYFHSCSRIINKSMPHDGRHLFISGDSQIIPDIPVLACYFREVWYFDNRTGYTTSKRDENNNYTISWNKDKHLCCEKYYKNKRFTDVLVQVYCAGLERYQKWNML